MKKLIALLLAACLMLGLMTTAFAADEKSNDIVILYTNDVHCAVDDNIGYAGLAAYKKEMQAAYNYVALVDCGDSVQGDVIGTLSKGEYLVDIMNEVGYDFASFGNHEFDYTLPQLQKLIDKAKYQYLCCNLTYTAKDGKGLTGYKAYEIKTYGDTKVAFVGIDTPESFTKSTPTYFQDANGKFVYSFAEGNNGADLYNKVQETVDAAKKDGATYVVAIAHLGIDESSEPWRSTDLIANTTGIDVLIDGHSHSTFAKTEKNQGCHRHRRIACEYKDQHRGKLKNGDHSQDLCRRHILRDRSDHDPADHDHDPGYRHHNGRETCGHKSGAL